MAVRETKAFQDEHCCRLPENRVSGREGKRGRRESGEAPISGGTVGTGGAREAVGRVFNPPGAGGVDPAARFGGVNPALRVRTIGRVGLQPTFAGQGAAGGGVEPHPTRAAGGRQAHADTLGACREE